MIYIVEGPDGAGKSTFIRKLLKQNPGAKSYHFGAPEPGVDQLLHYAEPILNNPTSTLIYDRSWYSEFVYGPVMRNMHELTTTHVRMLEALALRHSNSVIYYLTAPTHILWERCQERGETYIETIEQLDKIATEYEKVMQELPELPVFRVDTSR